MNLILSFLVIIISGIIFYQDYKERQVYLLLFPCLFICGFSLNLLSHTVYEILYYFLINLLIVVFQFCLLYLYFRIKKSNIYENIGAGDILCIVALCFFFSTANFLLFYLLSQIFALLIHTLLIKSPNEELQRTVPLAGLQTLALSLVIILHLFKTVSLMNDNWIITIF